MNDLEKGLKNLELEYETDGKQYKIPTSRENLIKLLKSYMDLSMNLQARIDRVIAFIEDYKKIIENPAESIVITDDVFLKYFLEMLRGEE